MATNPKKIRNRAHAIAKWWAEKMQKPLNQNNGDDGPIGGFAFLLMNMNGMNAQKSLTQAKIEQFEVCLAQILLNKKTRFLHVDYHPCEELDMACSMVQIDCGCLPVKSSTSINIRTGVATGRYQYGGKEEIIWDPNKAVPDTLRPPTELTLDFLKDEANRGKTFATGVSDEPGLHHKPIRWLAKVGDGFHDWAIYYHLENTPVDFIKTNGEKVTTESIIRKLVPCTDEAYSFYRR